MDWDEIFRVRSYCPTMEWNDPNHSPRGRAPQPKFFDRQSISNPTIPPEFYNISQFD